MNNKNVIIIGSGPAGLTAAIYLARAGLDPLLIEGTFSGGQLMTTTEVENYPGFPDGITGPELIEKMKTQAKKFGTEFLWGDVTKTDFKTVPFKLTVDKHEFSAKSIIIATGAQARYLDLPAVDQLKGRGVSGCATCDGFFFKNKIVFVIGGGDTAAEDALYLTNFAREVYIIHRRDQLRTEKYLQDKLFANPKITIIWDSLVQDIKDAAKGKVEKIILRNKKTNELTEKNADGIFMAIGHKPSTDIFKDQLELDENGYIKVHERTKTSIKGIFAAGDVIDPHYRQAISAAGSGCMAALDANKYLQ